MVRGFVCPWTDSIANRLSPAARVAFARRCSRAPYGVIDWGFIFWLLTSLGVLQNDLGGQLLAFAFLLGVSIALLRGGKLPEIKTWCKQNLHTLLVVEGLFLLVFVLWCWCVA